ncbi:hypothetical protein AGABI2DRAFT_189504 [Agaricus bisporus var. bisporus H97]|uniref:hypothetical protein n=1 Tax=Agaricus bisporus var. bisporus (strain H97 / ATCC MYA-4626 / FGSC 10389) TaxID=936046 RepID=UPI00029F76B6|nr:hypothetical protein AGABI2DRAFT_189504 [Agaricus bisporus var. bisporus H97]EKV51244.1 hypothetical protein AGABI2DRAFT_189504 [Agaricus bisporus var. bisporus H97]
MLEQGIEVWRDNQRRLQAQSVRQVQGRRPGYTRRFCEAAKGFMSEVEVLDSNV